MDEGQLLMTQAERDRLVVRKKAKKRLMTQTAAAEEPEVSERQIRKVITRLKVLGDKSVIHGSKGNPSNPQLEEEIQKKTLEILSDPRCHDFGPTYARDHLGAQHAIEVSKETIRQWMIEGKLWGRKKPERKVHVWRERRSCWGELVVQWDTSTHDWLEDRGSVRIYLITMIDDATSRMLARFVPHDSTEENMQVLQIYLERFGRPQAVYTDKASLFQTAVRTKRWQSPETKDGKLTEPTPIGRALRELGINWIAAHSPQAKGRVERSFQTGQGRLVKDLRMASVTTLDQASLYLDEHYLPWWHKNLAVEPRRMEDVHRPLEEGHDLAAVLSHVECRIVKTDYTFQFERQQYVIERADIRSGLRGAIVRVEKRRDGTLAVRLQQHYLRYRCCGSGDTTETRSRHDRHPRPPGRNQCRRADGWTGSSSKRHPL